MNIEEIEQVIKLLKQYDLHKVCIEDNSFKLEIYGNKELANSLKEIELISDDSKVSSLPMNDQTKEYVVKSPLVGCVNILQNELTGRKYTVGDRIQKGQTVCTIEAMKTFNEIISNRQGIIAEILVDDNQFVEYDQPLFKLYETR